MELRRVSSERSAPNARFTRSQRSGSLPASLVSNSGKGLGKPLLIFGGGMLLVSLGIALVIAVGAYVRAEQGFEEVAWRSTYYGLPTQPFATLVPGVGQPAQIIVPFGGAQSDTLTLASLDDPRWVRGSAAPTGTTFALYATPSLNDQLPLQWVNQVVEVMFIIQPHWGGWGQVQFGETIAWVDTSTVRLEAD